MNTGRSTASAILAASGVCCLAAGLTVSVLSRFDEQTAGSKAAERLLAAFDTDAEVRDSEARALVELAESGRATRLAFLRQGLTGASGAGRLNAHEHGLSVALSRVDRTEAWALFQGAIIPAIEGSADALVLRACFALMERWDVADEMSARERDGLASKIVERITRETDVPLRNELISGLALLEPELGSAIAEDLSSQLVAEILQEPDASVARMVVMGLSALGEKLGETQAGRLASDLMNHGDGERNPRALVPLMAALEVVGPRIDARSAAELASRLVARMLAETDAVALHAIANAIVPLKGRVTGTQADDLAEKLMNRMTADANTHVVQSFSIALGSFSGGVSPAGADRLIAAIVPFVMAKTPEQAATFAWAIGAFADRPEPHIIQQVRDALVARLSREQDSLAVANMGFSLSALSSRLPPGGFEGAATTVAAHIRDEREPFELALLSDALAALAKSGVRPEKAGELSGVLMERMGREYDPAALLRVAAGLEGLASLLPENVAQQIALKLIDRMDGGRGPSSLRTFAFSVGALEDGAGDGLIEAAATKLSNEIAKERSPLAIRALVAGMLGLGEKVNARHFEAAASRLTTLIAAEPNAVDLLDLAASLHALGDRVSEEHFGKAGLALVERILMTRDAADIRRITVSLAKLQEDIDPEDVEILAAKLTERITKESRPEILRVFGEVLGRLPASSLTGAQVDSMERVFSIPHAPCDVAARVSAADRLKRLMRQLQNPLCTEASWQDVAVALALLTRQPVAAAEPDGDEVDADFTTLVVEDDDGESGEAKESFEGPVVDFNTLSKALDPFRSAGTQFLWTTPRLVSWSLLLAGVVLLILALRRYRRS